MAELGRRGLLLPERLADGEAVSPAYRNRINVRMCACAVVPVVLQALDYDEQRGTYSVGRSL